MTEFEFIQVADMAGNSLGDTAMNLITVVFAYVVASHFAGNKLNRVAAVSLSVVYSLWLTGPLLGVFSALNLAISNALEFNQVYPGNYAIGPPPTFPELFYLMVIGPLILGWAGSLLYMHAYVRKNRSPTSSKDT